MWGVCWGGCAKCMCLSRNWNKPSSFFWGLVRDLFGSRKLVREMSGCHVGLSWEEGVGVYVKVVFFMVVPVWGLVYVLLRRSHR